MVFETPSGVKTIIEPNLWSEVVGSSIDIHSEGSCGAPEVRINLLGQSLNVTSGVTGSAMPTSIFVTTGVSGSALPASPAYRLLLPGRDSWH